MHFKNIYVCSDAITPLHLVKYFQILSLNKSRAEEVQVICMENVYLFKSLSDKEELYIIYFNVCMYVCMYACMYAHI